MPFAHNPKAMNGREVRAFVCNELFGFFLKRERDCKPGTVYRARRPHEPRKNNAFNRPAPKTKKNECRVTVCYSPSSKKRHKCRILKYEIGHKLWNIRIYRTLYAFIPSFAQVPLIHQLLRNHLASTGQASHACVPSPTPNWQIHTRNRP